MASQNARDVINAFLVKHIRPAMAVLDVGCGYGETVVLIARRVAGVTVEAVDVDAEGVHRANRRFRRSRHGALLRCYKADVRELVRLFGRTRFNFAICNNSFHEFSRPVPALRQVRAVLKPDGVLLLAELTPRAGEAMDDCPRYSREKIVELIRRGGFGRIAAATRASAILIRATKET